MRLLLPLVILSIVATAARAAGKFADSADVRQRHWHVQVSAARGIALWYDDVPVSRQSTFYIVKPGWTGLLYDQRASAPQVSVVQTSDGGQVITATTQNEDTTVGETVTLGADGSATVTLAFGLTRDVPANFEYAAAYLNADLLADAPFSAVTGQGVKTGTIPYATPGTDQAANKFVPSFRQLSLGTRLGQMQMAVSGDCPTSSASTRAATRRAGRARRRSSGPVFTRAPTPSATTTATCTISPSAINLRRHPPMRRRLRRRRGRPSGSSPCRTRACRRRRPWSLSRSRRT